MQKKMKKPISLLARISNALLSTVVSSRPVICAFAAALRVNTQTVETQLSQMPRRFNCSPCASGFMMLCSVAVDWIALNYWDKHKRKMAIRGIN